MGVTRFPNGIGTAGETTLLGQLPLPNPAGALHMLFDDFDLFPEDAVAAQAANAINWETDITLGGGISLDKTGNPTNAQLIFATNGSTNDVARMKPWGNGFNYEFGRRTWFEFRFIPEGDFSTNTVHLGLANNLNTNPPNAIYFPVGSASPTTDSDFSVEIRVRSNSVNTFNEITPIECFAGQSLALGAYWDGEGTLAWYANGVLVGRTTLTEAQLPLGYISAHMGIETNENNAALMRVDYALAAQDRS